MDGALSGWLLRLGESVSNSGMAGRNRFGQRRPPRLDRRRFELLFDVRDLRDRTGNLLCTSEEAAMGADLLPWLHSDHAFWSHALRIARRFPGAPSGVPFVFLAGPKV